MVRRNEERHRAHAGGILSLARFKEENREALNFDLLTRTGHDLSEVGDTMPWLSFRDFVQQIGLDSALARSLYPEQAAWDTTAKTNAILADIFDVLAAINTNLMAIGSKKRPQRPKPYPRPGAKKGREKKIGRGALPHDELVKFFERKRHGRHD